MTASERAAGPTSLVAPQACSPLHGRRYDDALVRKGMRPVPCSALVLTVTTSQATRIALSDLYAYCCALESLSGLA